MREHLNDFFAGALIAGCIVCAVLGTRAELKHPSHHYRRGYSIIDGRKCHGWAPWDGCQ
jgi:hypothetical protein